MVAKKRAKRGVQVPLIIEEHPAGYDGYPFITLIQYRNQHMLTIVDNATSKEIRAIVLDLCGPEKVDEEQIIQVAADWYQNESDRYPVSFAFSNKGMSSEVGKLIKTLTIDFVTRVIGPLPQFPMDDTPVVKRRRRKPVPDGIEVNKKYLKLVQ